MYVGEHTGKEFFVDRVGLTNLLFADNQVIIARC
jgi:hypothetical protein